jgi:exodeoxyribonuclease VII large subunit
VANLRTILYAWRDNEAAKRSVELFRVLPNSAIDEIVRALPRTKEELTAIKGIKDAKYREFGKVILALVDEHMPTTPGIVSQDNIDPFSDPTSDDAIVKNEKTIFTVSTYLDIVNRELYRLHARVKGEVTSIKAQGSAVYIGLKDGEDDSSLSVFMWARDYALAGIEIVEGMEVAVEGRSEVYKPSGRLSFRAETIELVGEGAWKKAYDALRKKLDDEGIFAPERKRALSEYPEQIGLITSKTGAVIHDFLNNLGKFGFKVRFMDSRVEGAAAVKDLLSAISYFSTQPIDTLVIIRGGGSLESLQAFNNERVVRAIAAFPKPVICAIGHDKDIPLAQLAADHAPSTPTAVTVLLNRSWEEGVHAVHFFTTDIMGLYHEQLWIKKDQLRLLSEDMRAAFSGITAIFSELSKEFFDMVIRTERALARSSEMLRSLEERIVMQFTQVLTDTENTLGEASRMLNRENPLRLLKLGYSILSAEGKVLRGVAELASGAHFEARLADGTLEAIIERITPKVQ